MTHPWPHGDPRDVARAIVADARYRVAVGPPPAPSWFDAARAWLGRLLRALLHGLDRALGANSPFETIVGFVVIAAVLAVLAYGVFALARVLVRRDRAPRGFTPGVALSSGEQSAAQLRAAAGAAAREHRFRDAAALLFLSAVRALDERGRVTYDAARTPGEYRRLVCDPVFDAFATDAVVAVFAAAEPRGDLYERMSGTYDRFFDTRG